MSNRTAAENYFRLQKGLSSKNPDRKAADIHFKGTLHRKSNVNIKEAQEIFKNADATRNIAKFLTLRYRIVHVFLCIECLFENTTVGRTWKENSETKVELLFCRECTKKNRKLAQCFI